MKPPAPPESSAGSGTLRFSCIWPIWPTLGAPGRSTFVAQSARVMQAPESDPRPSR